MGQSSEDSTMGERQGLVSGDRLHLELKTGG